jgi:hypothetical protein
MTDGRTFRSFSDAIAKTIEGIKTDPADTIRQLEIVRDETAAYLHRVRERADRDEAGVDTSEMLAAETRLLLTATAGVLVEAYASDRFVEGSETAERIGLLLDDLSRSAREDDLKTVQERRVETATALEGFAARLS